MKTNSDRFLNAFNQIEKYLKSENNNQKHSSFYKNIKISNNKTVKRFKEELFSFGDLRNAIVHSTKIEEKVIAEPHDSITTRIEDIKERIINPKKASYFFFQVLGAESDDEVREILLKMRKESFSQFPIFKDGKVIEICNTNTISRWFASNIDEDSTVIFDNVKIKDFLEEIEVKQNYKFVSRNTTVDELYYLFLENIEEKKHILDVIFITDSGKNGEKLLGCVTIEDIAPFFKN